MWRDPCPWASIDAASHWYSRWFRVARGCADRQRTPGSRGGVRAVRVPPSRCLDHRSALFATRQAHAGASWCSPVEHSLHPSRPSLAKMSIRVVRSTKVPTADRLRAPLSKSLSQWPGILRVATSAGRSVTDVMLEIWPWRSVPRVRGRRVLRA